MYFSHTVKYLYTLCYLFRKRQETVNTQIFNKGMFCSLSFSHESLQRFKITAMTWLYCGYPVGDIYLDTVFPAPNFTFIKVHTVRHAWMTLSDRD